MTAPRWFRSARRRPAAFTATALLSAGAVLVAAMTPMLVGALDAATLRELAASAPMPENGIAVSATAVSDDVIADAENAVSLALTAATGASDRWGEPRTVLEPSFTAQLTGPDGGTPLAARFSVTEDACAGLRVTGRCPTDASEALVPATLLPSTSWTTGTALTTPIPDGPPLRLTVVGTFRDEAGPGRALADPTVLQRSTVPRAVPNLVIGQVHLQRLQSGFQVTGGVRLARPLRQADLVDVRRSITAAKQAVTGPEVAAVSPLVTTEVPALLRSAGQQQAAVEVLATPIGLAALVLAWSALGAVVQRTARSRAAEWGVGRMRGARPRRWFSAVFVEPGIAILAGAALGLPLAVVVARSAAAGLFGSADDVAPLSSPVLAAVVLATAGSLIALVASSARAVSRPLADLLQDTAEPRRSSRPALVGQVVVVSIAAAVIWTSLTTAGLGGARLGLLLPAVSALLIGVAAVRVAVVVVRRTARRTPRSLLALVVGRGLARTPSALVAAQLVLVSTTAAACALQLGIASASLQTDRANLATGAPTVLTVRVPRGTSLLQAVREADPGGRTAMAAADLDVTAVGGSRVTAVDTTRIDAVAAWRREWRGGLDLSRLRPRVGPDLDLRGTRLTVDVADLSDYGDPDDPEVATRLGALLARPDGWTSAVVGTLRNGRVSGSIPCRDGCRLVALTLRQAGGDQYPWSKGLTITSLSTDEQPASTLQAWLRGSRWRSRVIDQVDGILPVHLGTSDVRDGLGLTVTDDFGGLTAQLEPTSGPATIPAVAGSAAPLLPFAAVRGAVSGSSLDDTPMLLRPIGRAPAVPRSLRTGVLVDLAQMERAADPSAVVAAQQVWLAPGSHPGVLAALRARGIQVVDVQRASDAVAVGLRSATNRALLVDAVAALVALVFGLLALVATRIIDMPERRSAWRTLRLAGVPHAALRRLGLVQMAVPGAIGAALGVATGSIVASVMVGRLPLLVGQTAGPPLDPAPPLPALAALLVTLTALVVAVSAVTMRFEIREDRA